MSAERLVIGIYFMGVGAGSLVDAIIAKPPAEWVPVWLYVATLLLVTPIWIYWGVRIWRHGVA